MKLIPFKSTLLLTSLICLMLVFNMPDTFAEHSVTKPTKSSDIPKSSSCGTSKCHVSILKDWSTSMHSMATRDKDPMVKAFTDYLEKDGHDTAHCRNCHEPFKALYPEGNHPKLQSEGVGCIFCHSIRGVAHREKYGIHYFDLEFFKIRFGPEGRKEIIHPVEPMAIFKKIDLCEGCHQSGEADYREIGKVTACQQCHMPSKKHAKSAATGKVKDKVSRHLFEGGHSELLLSMATILEGRAKVVDGRTELTISIENSSLHQLPIGFPLRAIYLKVTAYNDKRQPVWSNYVGNPLKEDPKSYFALIYKNEDALYAHYVKNAKPVSNTRLKPSSEKTITYTVDSTNIKYFKAQLYYKLLTESVMKRLGMDAVAKETLMLEEIVNVRQ